MSVVRARSRWPARVALALGFIGFVSGCPDRPEPVAPTTRGTWRVRAVVAPTGTPPLSMGVGLDGPPGFVRATLVVERPADPAAGVSARTALYDTLFPVGPAADLRVEATPPTPPATAPRVSFQVDSAGTASESFVEPAVPLFTPGAVVTWTTALVEGQTLADGREVEVGRWTITVGPTATVAVVHLLGSRRPVGPRLKGAGSPPT